MNTDTQVQILMWVMGGLISLLTLIANRFVGALDGVKSELHKVGLALERFPSKEDVEKEAKRAAHEAVLNHEIAKHSV